MARRRGAVIIGSAVALVFSVAVTGQQQLDEKTQETLTREAQALSRLADDALVKEAGANELNISWQGHDFLRGPEGRQFVPFTITLDPTKVPSGNLLLYWRVSPPAPEGGAKPEESKPLWQGVSFVTTEGQQPLRLSRSFVAPPGSVDVYVVAKELQVERPRNAPDPQIALVKETVDVPDYWNGEFTTSSVIVTESIEPLAAPLSQEQVAERPYAALGVLELHPVSDTNFAKAEDLSVFFLVYNAQGDSANKPDVSVEYNFCQIMAGAEPEPDQPCKAGEKFYNKTEPQALNAQTLPAQFDLTMGHQLQTGQAVPLSAFPEGDYRLEIKVTDKLANKTVTRDVNFRVAAS
jgi:hypothetical protein